MQLQNRNSLYPAVLAMLILFSCARGDGELPPPNLVTPPEVEPPSKFAIATSAGEGGSITDNQNVDSGQSVEITATAQEHYQLKQWQAIVVVLAQTIQKSPSPLPRIVRLELSLKR